MYRPIVNSPRDKKGWRPAICRLVFTECGRNTRIELLSPIMNTARDRIGHHVLQYDHIKSQSAIEGQENDYSHYKHD